MNAYTCHGGPSFAAGQASHPFEGVSENVNEFGLLVWVLLL